MSLSGKTDNPSFVLRGIHDTVYEDVSPADITNVTGIELNGDAKSPETHS